MQKANTGYTERRANSNAPFSTSRASDSAKSRLADYTVVRVGREKKGGEPFSTGCSLSLSISLYLSLSPSPHDPILLFNHVYSLPPFRQLFSPPIRLMQSISQNRLDGIIRGARERTVHPLQSSSNKSNTQSIHTQHTQIISSSTSLQLWEAVA